MNQENKQLPTEEEHLNLFLQDYDKKINSLNTEEAISFAKRVEYLIDKVKYYSSLREELEKLRAENERLKQRGDKFYNDLKLVAAKNQKLRETLEKFAVMGQEDGNLNEEYHVLTSTGTEKYPVSEAVRVTKNILKLVNHIAKEALKGGDNNGV